MGYLVIGFRIRHNNTGPCGFKLQALQKGVIMQTNCLLQQYTCSQAKTQSAVTAWSSGLHCFLLFHRTVAPYWNTPRPPAPTASLSIKICLQTKGARSLFFSLSLFWRIWSPLRRCLVAFTTVQFKGSLIFFFLCPTTFRDLGQVGLELQQRPQEERQISHDGHPLCGLWHHRITTKSS